MPPLVRVLYYTCFICIIERTSTSMMKPALDVSKCIHFLELMVCGFRGALRYNNTSTYDHLESHLKGLEEFGVVCELCKVQVTHYAVRVSMETVENIQWKYRWHKTFSLWKTASRFRQDLN